MARLLFEKRAGTLQRRVRITELAPCCGIARNPPIPVQLSKNWHERAEAGAYSGVWFHGISQIRVPAKSDIGLELTLSYGHWGGVAAASHAQLCLIGWGSNQLWDQSALGSWGESICYEPDRIQAQCGILDVRPVMVKSMSGNKPWNWTHNIGGGDSSGSSIRSAVIPRSCEDSLFSHGPCLTGDVCGKDGRRDRTFGDGQPLDR